MFFSGLSYPELDIHNSGSQHAGGRGPLLRRCTERVSIEAIAAELWRLHAESFLAPRLRPFPFGEDELPSPTLTEPWRS